MGHMLLAKLPAPRSLESSSHMYRVPAFRPKLALLQFWAMASSGKSAVAGGGSAGPSSALQPTVPRRPVVVPSSSRASARAQRRIQASAARRRTSSEVLLLTSKAFPPEQYQELLTFLKGLHLPPDATSLFTTVRNDQFANKKALVSSSSKEVDEVLARYGGDWALLSLCAEELGLGGARQGPGSPSSGQRSRELSSGLSASVEAANRPGSAGQAPPRFSGAEWRFSGDLEMPALSQKWAERPPRTDGVVRRAGGGGYSLSVEALGVPVFVCDAEGRVAEWNPCLATLTGTEVTPNPNPNPRPNPNPDPNPNPNPDPSQLQSEVWHAT